MKRNQSRKITDGNRGASNPNRNARQCTKFGDELEVIIQIKTAYSMLLSRIYSPTFNDDLSSVKEPG